MPERKNPQTSIDAYRSLDLHKMREIFKKILHALGEMGEATTEEIAAFEKVSHERVWKRMTDLHKMELIYRPGNKRVLKSGSMGYTWMLTMGATPKTEKVTEKAMGGEGIEDISRNIQGIQDKVKQATLFY